MSNDFWQWVTMVVVPCITGYLGYSQARRREKKEDLRVLYDTLYKELEAVKKELAYYKEKEMELSRIVYEHLDTINQLKQEIRMSKNRTV